MENITSNPQIHGHPLRQVLLLLLACGYFFALAQPPLSSTDRKAIKTYQKADKKAKERDFESAIALFDQATQSDNSFYEAYLRKGSLYNALGNEDSVYVNFTRYTALAPSPSASVLEKLSFMAFDRGHYDQSEAHLTSFLKIVPEKKSDRNIDLLARSLRFAENQLQKSDEIGITQLPQEINRYGLQYLPTMTVDQKTLVFTKRDQFSSDEDIVVSYFENGKWNPAVSVSQRINSSANEGAATISADGRTMIFTACDRRDTYGSCDLYITYKSGEVWSRPKNLGKKVNSKYWESQPSLSADGRTLYFTSSRPGGFGGRDIWVTYKTEEQWGNPENLGSQVNSFKDETTPFAHFNGLTLFFSSDSYVGMGGFDLFKVDRKDSTWTTPTNLGYPINTHKDEVALLLSSDSRKGYFALETKKNLQILDSKIVSFEVPDEIRPISSHYVSGRVVDSSTGSPLKARLEIFDIENGHKLYDNYSDSVSGRLYMVLQSGRSLAGYVKKKGYLFQNFSFSTGESEGVDVDTITVALSRVDEGSSLILKNIYFETNSYELDQRSDSEIGNVVELLKQNPGIKVEISGHTDNIGRKEYNMELSEKRAYAVFTSLVDNGIDRDRLAFVGFGDTKPLLPNENDLNRQSNRRIEFRVIRQKQ